MCAPRFPGAGMGGMSAAALSMPGLGTMVSPADSVLPCHDSASGEGLLAVSERIHRGGGHSRCELRARPGRHSNILTSKAAGLSLGITTIFCQRTLAFTYPSRAAVPAQRTGGDDRRDQTIGAAAAAGRRRRAVSVKHRLLAQHHGLRPDGGVEAGQAVEVGAAAAGAVERCRVVQPEAVGMHAVAERRRHPCTPKRDAWAINSSPCALFSRNEVKKSAQVL